MPSKKRDGMTAIYVEIPDDMAAELEGFVKQFPLGAKADHVRLALRRHMDSPPTIVTTPLPPVTVEVPAEKPKGRAKP